MNSQQQGGFPSQMQYQQQQQQQQQPIGTQYLKNQVQQQQQQQMLRMQQQQQQQQLSQPITSDMITGNGKFMSMLQQQQGVVDDLKKIKKTTLVGRMDELKNAPVDKHMYVFGMDIPQTGIANLNQDTQINATFGSPFAENPSIKTDSLNFTIPQSYLKPQVTLSASLIKKLPEDTLFYIFYNFPEDTQQFAAVLALYERGWRYNQTQLSWMRNLEEIAKGIYKGEYFDFTEWKIVPLNGVAINEDEDLVSVQDFEKQLGNNGMNEVTSENSDSNKQMN